MWSGKQDQKPQSNQAEKGVESCEKIIKHCHNCYFCRVVGSIGRLKGFKKVGAVHVFGELGSNSWLNKFGQIS